MSYQIQLADQIQFINYEINISQTRRGPSKISHVCDGLLLRLWV
jgi:hypothetical protein